MEDKNGLTRQLQILSVVNKNEDKLKKGLLVAVVLIMLSSAFLSVSFSYKAYKSVQNIMAEKKIDSEEKVSYETLSVSYENGSVLNCINGECNDIVVKISNTGGNELAYDISFSDIVGDASYYSYSITSNDISRNGSAPSNNMTVEKGARIGAGQAITYVIRVEQTADVLNNYQAKVLVSMNDEKNSLLG